MKHVYQPGCATDNLQNYTQIQWCDKLQTCQISGFFFSSFFLVLCSSSVIASAFPFLLWYVKRRKQHLGPLCAWSFEGEGGCPRATLHRRTQSLKQSCWKVLASRGHIPQALPLVFSSSLYSPTGCCWEETSESWIYDFWQSIWMPWAKKHFC